MKWNLRRLALVVLVIAVLAVAIAFLIAAVVPRNPPNVVRVQRGDISASVSATGKVASQKAARLALPQAGVVAAIDKKPGDEVNAGDVILSLKADDAQRRVSQAELTVQMRQLDLARAKAAPSAQDIEIARANLNKATIAAAAASAVYDAASTPQNSALRENAQADLDIARANFDKTVNGPTQDDLQALENNVTYAQIDLASAKAALAQMKVTAPFTSTVTEVDVHEGELVGGFTPLAAVADLHVLEIDAQVDEIDVAHVQVGQAVDIRFDAFPGESFTGKLTRLFPAASTDRGSTVYGAVVNFDPGASNIRPGMGANLKINTIEKKDVLLVPNRALVTVGTRKAVHVVGPGQPRDVIVETGVSDGNQTEIVSGLQEGDIVALQ
ncbi:MAG: efflux RND transporter periplasmic adaptor subunit [Chloroflexi bacterium]|nr:efflux RND transporter periplasmic adaptor subunit [Chloroflexota bacterium]